MSFFISFFISFYIFEYLLILYHNKKLSNINKGDELGWFKYGGSTVVLLFQKGKITISDDLVYNSVVRIETLVKMGQEIGVSP